MEEEHAYPLRLGLEWAMVGARHSCLPAVCSECQSQRVHNAEYSRICQRSRRWLVAVSTTSDIRAGVNTLESELSAGVGLL